MMISYFKEIGLKVSIFEVLSTRIFNKEPIVPGFETGELNPAFVICHAKIIL